MSYHKTTNQIHAEIRRDERLRPWRGSLLNGAWFCTRCEKIHSIGNEAGGRCPFCGILGEGEFYPPIL